MIRRLGLPLICIWFDLIAWSISGTIFPEGNQPIALGISNVKEYSLYTFTFRCESDVPESSKIIIYFPIQYQENLGIPLWADCSEKCEVNNRRVTFWPKRSIKKGTKLSMWIDKIKNPSQSG